MDFMTRAVGQASFSINVFTLFSISSLICRTFSIGLLFGSSSPQSTVVLKKGPGHKSCAPQPIVMIRSASSTILGVTSFGLLFEILMPLSFMASTTVGFTLSASLMPALEAEILSFPYWFAKASAIWLLPAFSTHTNSIFLILSFLLKHVTIYLNMFLATGVLKMRCLDPRRVDGLKG